MTANSADPLPHVIFNGHTYILTNPSLSWAQSEALAVSLGGHLATIDPAIMPVVPIVIMVPMVVSLVNDSM